MGKGVLLRSAAIRPDLCACNERVTARFELDNRHPERWRMGGTGMSRIDLMDCWRGVVAHVAVGKVRGAVKAALARV